MGTWAGYEHLGVSSQGSPALLASAGGTAIWHPMDAPGHANAPKEGAAAVTSFPANQSGGRRLVAPSAPICMPSNTAYTALPSETTNDPIHPCPWVLQAAGCLRNTTHRVTCCCSSCPHWWKATHTQPSRRTPHTALQCTTLQSYSTLSRPSGSRSLHLHVLRGDGADVTHICPCTQPVPSWLARGQSASHPGSPCPSNPLLTQRESADTATSAVRTSRHTLHLTHRRQCQPSDPLPCLLLGT